jgi:hypothetical protein
LTLQHALERLREVGHGEPGEAGWSRLQQIVSHLRDPEGLAVALAYAAPLLERWPPALRRLGARQARRLLDGGQEPCWPLVRVVQVTEASAAQLARLVALPPLEGEVALELHLGLMEEGAQVGAMEALARSWWSARASSLRVHNSRLGDAALGALLSRPWARVERLSVERNQLTGLAWLRAQALPALRALDLSHNANIDRLTEGLEAARLPRLESLRLQGFYLSRELEGLMGLLGSAALPRLEVLEVPDDVQVPTALQARWAQMRERLPGRFSPEGPLLEAEALSALSARGALDAVRVLTLPQLAAPRLEALLAALATRGALPRLMALDVTGCSPRGLSQVLSAPWGGQLQALLLRGAPGAQLGDAEARALGGAEGLGALRFVSLYQQGVGLAGLQGLLGGAGLPRLEVVDLWENPLGVEALRWLAQDARAGQLRRVAVDVYQQGEGAVEALAHYRPARGGDRNSAQHLGGALRDVPPLGLGLMGRLNSGDLDNLSLPPAALAEAVRWASGSHSARIFRLGPASWSLEAVEALRAVRPLTMPFWSFSNIVGLGASLGAFLDSPWGAALYGLTIQGGALGAQGLAALLAWEAPALRHLSLYNVADLGLTELEAIRDAYAPRCRVILAGAGQQLQGGA